MKIKQLGILKVSTLFLFILIATQSCMVSSLHPLYTDIDRVHLDKLDGVWLEEDNTRFEITTIVDSVGLESKKAKTDPKEMSVEDAFFNGLDGKKTKSTIENTNAFFEGKSKTVNTSEIEQSKIENFFFKPDLRKHYQIKIFSEKDTSTFDGKLSQLDKYYFLDIIPDDDALEKKLNDDYLIGLVAPMHGFLKLQFMGGKLKVNWIESNDFKELRKEKKLRLKSIKQNDREIITAKTSDIQKFLIKFADTELFNNEDSELILTPVK